MMKRTLFIIFSIAILPLVFSFGQPSAERKVVQTILIDPGHGGADIGAKGSYSTEAEICLSIGLKLGKHLEKEIPGIKILYTRTTDIIPGNKSNKNDGLRYRADFANQSGADLFVSIHVNSAPRIRHRVPSGYRYVGKGSKRRKVTNYKTYYTSNPAYGTETYVWAADETKSKESRITMNPEDISGETDSTIVAPDMNDPIMKAFQLLYAKKYFQNSVQLAELVEHEFVKAGRLSRGVKQRNDVGIWVLHATGMPSVLIETGFIGTEEDYLNSDKGQKEIVENIANALKNYITIVEKQPAASNTGENNLPQPKNSKTNTDMLIRKDKSSIPG